MTNNSKLLSQIEEFYKFHSSDCNKLVYFNGKWEAINHPYGCESEECLAEGKDLEKVVQEFKKNYPKGD
ncbi:MAG: hypothetical protein PHS34_09650 [Candidatus Omnitrophica bacterium]|nr:hypothetical protein [Candidatus Omnitrophota bacterium]